MSRSGPVQLGVAALLAAGWLLAVPAAEAQRRGSGGQQTASAASRCPRCGGGCPTQPITVTLPPEPITWNSSGTLERNFQIMRNSAPDPETYAHGRWNPRTITVQPACRAVGVGFGAAPIATPVFGGFGGFGGGFGGFGPPYPPQREVYVERTLVIREGAGQQQQQQTQTQPPPQSFYPQRPPAAARATESINTALDDLRRAWLNGDGERFKARLRAEGEVRVFVDGKYGYSVETGALAELAVEAMEAVDTVGFEFNGPRQLAAQRVLVTGKHTYLDADKKQQEIHVSYVLERGGDGRWVVVETGSSYQPISGHQDA